MDRAVHVLAGTLWAASLGGWLAVAPGLLAADALRRGLWSG